VCVPCPFPVTSVVTSCAVKASSMSAAELVLANPNDLLMAWREQLNGVNTPSPPPLRTPMVHTGATVADVGADAWDAG